jgi:hypothetical protein
MKRRISANQALLLEFLSSEESERSRVVAELRTLLDRQHIAGTDSSGSIPCRRPLGLIVLLSRPVALRLVAALESF